MRRYVKREILNLLDTLLKASKSIKKVLSSGGSGNDQLLSLLQDCQDAAISVGDSIEKSEGEGTEAVKHLEEYCEILYRFSTGEEKATYKLDTCLNACKNEIRQLPERIEAVFLPYKASMWDSLESVWKAADEDPDCDAYVIPIPYFDKNPDGSFREEHYEGNLYPDYVPITDYRTYDLETRHPDMVFIHNPYDEFNLVTSVHPGYYSKEIRKYTDQLIYIPYFIHQNDSVRDDYCVLPGTVYADKIILQSEKVREQYLKYYKDELKDNNAEKKFLALGSPKFDMENYTLEDYPSEWRTKLFLYGERRKVLFFNTHILCLMEKYNADFRIKVQEIFHFFEENKEFLLLWRPHPLSLATARSMNKESEEAFIQLIEDYKKKDFGIYDDTPDVHRAVSFSDAYYGNKSSVIEMFKAEGKPVMIMNLKMHA